MAFMSVLLMAGIFSAFVIVLFCMLIGAGVLALISLILTILYFRGKRLNGFPNKWLRLAAILCISIAVLMALPPLGIYLSCILL